MVKVGIIGGTGLDNPEIFQDRKEKFVETPFGKPSDALILGTIKGVDCVLLARHDRGHTIAPSNVNFRANIWALKQEGVDVVITTTACGSLREAIEPGHLVILDQGIDFTSGRQNSFYDGSPAGPKGVCHISMADPCDSSLREVLLDVTKTLGVPTHPKGTVVTINGPRFSTRAESHMFRGWGGDVINMTSFPELPLFAEAGLPMASLALATDYDCWRVQESGVNVTEVMEVLKHGSHTLTKVLLELVPRLAAADLTQSLAKAKANLQNAIILPKVM